MVFRQKDANGIANSEVPDQTAPLGSALFAQTYLSENFGSLRYNLADQIGTSNSINTMDEKFLYEPRHEKTNILLMRKQRRRSASLFSLHR